MTSGTGNASMRFIHKSFIDVDSTIEDFPFELLACDVEEMNDTHYSVKFRDDSEPMIIEKKLFEETHMLYKDMETYKNVQSLFSLKENND